MGTAVLLPRDCLPISKSRHKNTFSGVLYGSDSTPRAGRSYFQVLDPCSFYPDQSRSMFAPNRRVEWSATYGPLPLPENGSAVLPIKSYQKEADRRRMKARRPVDPRDVKLASRSGSDAPVFTILQRPKDKDVADKIMTKFLAKVDQAEARNGAPDTTPLDLKADELKFSNGIRNAVLEMKKGGGSNSKKGMSDLKSEGPKTQDLKLDVLKHQDSVLIMKLDRHTLKDSKADRGKYHMGASSKPMNVTKRDVYSRLEDLEPLKGLNEMSSLKVTGEHKSLQTAGVVENFNCKLAYANQPTRVDNIVGGGLTRLRRASTDPQMVKQLVSQYRSAVMEIPCGEVKSHHGFARTSSMSCPERWAGPAYTASPAPSSLPLPKFSLPNQKMPSLDLPPLLVERHDRNMAQPPELGSSPSVPGSPQGVELDVAFATKSLRRMLKLDPF